MKRLIALLLAALLMVSCALADVALRGYDANPAMSMSRWGSARRMRKWRRRADYLARAERSGRAERTAERICAGGAPHPQRLSGVRQQAHQQEETRFTVMPVKLK